MLQSKVLPSILVVDDEEPARAELIRIIEEGGIDFTLYEAANSEETLAQLDENNCGIVFLDIQLCDQNGLHLAKKMLKRPAPPLIIMATAHDKYALQGFELDVVDYILKPFRSRRVEKALDKAMSIFETSSPQSQELESVLRNVSGSIENISKLWAERENGSRLMINFSDIHWIQAKNKKVYVSVAEGELRVRATLSELSERLPQDTFIRVHKAYIVNINLVREVIPWDSHAMTLVMGNVEATEIPVGRGYADKLKQLVGW